jgi:hypothetical protein
MKKERAANKKKDEAEVKAVKKEEEEGEGGEKEEAEEAKKNSAKVDRVGATNKTSNILPASTWATPVFDDIVLLVLFNQDRYKGYSFSIYTHMHVCLYVCIKSQSQSRSKFYVHTWSRIHLLTCTLKIN